MIEKHQIILTTLSKSEKPLSRLDIFNSLDPSEQGMFTKGIDGLSKDLDVLKAKKGMLESLYDQTTFKPIMVWRLTAVGQAMAAKLMPTPVASEPALKIREDENGLPVIKMPLSAIDDLIPDREPEETVSLAQDEPFTNLLDALNYYREAASMAISAANIVQAHIDQANALVAQVTVPKLQNKETLLATIQNLGAFMSDDIKAQLDYAAEVLGELEGA